MMRRAGRQHAAWGVMLCLRAGAFATWSAARVMAGNGRTGLQARLLEAATEDVPAIVREMGPYRRWLDRPLREAYAEAQARADSADSCTPAWGSCRSIEDRPATSSTGC